MFTHLTKGEKEHHAALLTFKRVQGTGGGEDPKSRSQNKGKIRKKKKPPGKLQGRARIGGE